MYAVRGMQSYSFENRDLVSEYPFEALHTIKM